MLNEGVSVNSFVQYLLLALFPRGGIPRQEVCLICLKVKRRNTKECAVFHIALWLCQPSLLGCVCVFVIAKEFCEGMLRFFHWEFQVVKNLVYFLLNLKLYCLCFFTFSPLVFLIHFATLAWIM